MADSIFEPEISRSLKRLVNIVSINVSVAIECKKETGTSLSFDRVNQDQIDALVNFETTPFHQKMLVSASVSTQSRFKLKSGFDFLCCPKGKSYVLVNFRATKKASGKDIPKGTNKCFVVSIGDYLEGKSNLAKEGRKSFPYSWFIENAKEAERIKWKNTKDENVYGWDLSLLLIE